MRQMKESGIEWIGKIPEGWGVKRLKYICNIDLEKLSENTEKDFSFDYIDIGSIGEFGTLGDLEKMTFENAPSRAKMILCKDDIIISTVRTYLRAISFINESNRFIASTGFAVLRTEAGYSPKYVFYQSLSEPIVHEIFSKSVGVSYPAINNSQLKEIKYVLPPPAVQDAIADYLDRKCSIIDSTIEKEKTVIEKLKHYKQSVITEAVTKGLDPTVKMKPSGIEWIGDIPEGWELIAFKYILKERREINFPIQTEERLSLSIDKGVTLYAEKTTNLDRFKDDVSQYKLAHVGDLVLNSMNMIVGAVGISKYFGCVSPAYYTYYDTDDDCHFTARYCDYLFKTKTIKKVLYSLGKGIMSIDRGDDRVNTCRLKVSRDDLRTLKLPIPSHQEQNSIVNFLDMKCEQIDVSINVKSNLIEKLAEYKKSLIYECVTGKKEVV